MKGWIIVLFVTGTVALCAQDRQLYIEAYSEIAIQEMIRSGIPASIKLAQGILESNAGSSTLATRANNHFGIKCGNDWRGRQYMKKDDDRNRRGKLVKSCFRVFTSPEESYVAHTEFLMDPNKSKRYGFLFDIPEDDYKSWARGLKRAGYATNPSYPELLIRIIEKYRLHEYDAMALGQIASREKSMPDVMTNERKASRHLNERPIRTRTYALLYQNGVQFVYAREGDSPKSLSRTLDVSAGKIVRINETIGGKRWRLQEGDRVYLQAKARKYKGSQKFHIVAPGETLEEIAQIYGVKAKVLAKRNGLEKDQDPAAGERLALRGRNKHPVRVTTNRSEDQRIASRTSRPVQITTDVPDANEQSASRSSDPQSTAVPEQQEQVARNANGDLLLDPIVPKTAREDKKRELNEIQQQVAQESGEGGLDITPIAPAAAVLYTVQPQDTLYRIARDHGLSVADLKKLNNLESDTIHPGQQLKLAE